METPDAQLCFESSIRFMACHQTTGARLPSYLCRALAAKWWAVEGWVAQGALWPVGGLADAVSSTPVAAVGLDAMEAAEDQGPQKIDTSHVVKTFQHTTFLYPQAIRLRNGPWQLSH